MKFLLLLLGLFCFLGFSQFDDDPPEDNCIEKVEYPKVKAAVVLPSASFEAVAIEQHKRKTEPLPRIILAEDYDKSKKIDDYHLAYGLSRIKRLQHG